LHLHIVSSEYRTANAERNCDIDFGNNQYSKLELDLYLVCSYSEIQETQFVDRRYIMSTLTIARPIPTSALHTYVKNVGQAGRLLLATLLAIEPHHSAHAAGTAVKAVESGYKHQSAGSLLRLYGVACQSDSVMPNLAAELRYIASRAQQ
jgi:hypothetical protein